MKFSKKVNKFSRDARKAIGKKNEKYVVVILVAIILSVGLANTNINLQSIFNPVPTSTTTIYEYVTETITVTTPTTTTTTIVSEPEFRFKAEWIWEPAMGTEKPSWIIIELHENNPAALYCDGVYMFSSSTWYYPSGSYHFQTTTSYRVYIVDSSGYNFQLDYETYQAVTPGYTGMSWELTNSGTGWGHLIFEWVEI